MIRLEHMALSFVLVFALPILLDFTLSLLKLSSFFPSVNSVSLTNSQVVKRYLRGFLVNRKALSFENCLMYSVLSAGNVFAFSVSLGAFEKASTAFTAEFLFTTILLFAFGSLVLRVLLFSQRTERINFSRFLNVLIFSLTCLTLVFASLSLSGPRVNFESSDGLLFAGVQMIVYLAFKKFFAVTEPLTVYEKHVGTSSRLAFNTLLMCFFLKTFNWETRVEYFVFILALAFILELLMALFDFEVLSTIKSFRRSSFEKSLLIYLVFVLGLKALI